MRKIKSLQFKKKKSKKIVDTEIDKDKEENNDENKKNINPKKEIKEKFG